MEGADGLACAPCAPVVKNTKGKKRRADGQACEAPDCDEFFSSSWYAQGRCCSKAGCKRFFGVAGVYQPKKVPKGILKEAMPLADRSNGQQAAAATKPPVAVATKPTAPAAKQAAPPGSKGERQPLVAIEALRERFGSGCFRHGAAKDDCEVCELNAAAFEACKEAELAPFRRSVETFQLVVRQGLLSATLSFTQPMQKGERRLPVAAWARHMELWVIDREADDDVFQYDGPCRDSFDVAVAPDREYVVGMALYGDATEKPLCEKLNVYFEPHIGAGGETREEWIFSTAGPAFGAASLMDVAAAVVGVDAGHAAGGADARARADQEDAPTTM